MKVLERSLWRWLAGARSYGAHVERIENMLSRSTPDVECSVGAGGFWIELKTAAGPAREETPVRFTFQQGQAAWLRRRWDIDHGAWILAQVGSARYLIPGWYAYELDSGVTVARLRGLSEVSMSANPGEVLRAASERLGR